MDTKDSPNRGRSPAAQQLLERVSKKLPPEPLNVEQPRWRLFVRALLEDPSHRLLWLLLRIGISVLIVVSLFVVGGQVGFIIALALFVVGVGVSMRIRRS
jgi:hypothetical protein